MSDRYNMKFTDRSGEHSSASFPVLASQGGYSGGIADLKAAVDAITLGTIGKQVTLTETEEGAGSQAIPANAAQRELKWLCRYENSVTGDLHRLEIPTANGELTTTGSDMLDLADGDVGEDFKNAFNAIVKLNNNNSHVADLISVQLVGRNI